MFTTDETEMLQEYIGYLQTPDTSQQKLIIVIGPTRSGKGTIGRVVNRLIGDRNVTSTTPTLLASRFGLEGLVGMSVVLRAEVCDSLNCGGVTNETSVAVPVSEAVENAIVSGRLRAHILVCD